MNSKQQRTVDAPNRVEAGAPDAQRFAIQLIKHGLPTESVRKPFGHRTLNMTQHYAGLYDATVQQQFAAATEALEGVFANDWPMPVSTTQPTPIPP